MYAPHQIDWSNRGYFTPSLHGEEMPPNPSRHAEWSQLQRHFTALMAGDFSQQRELIQLAHSASSGMMRRYFLYLLTDAGTAPVLRALADHTLETMHLDLPEEVAEALAKTGMIQFIPDVLELYARCHDGGTFSIVLPRLLSTALEPELGELSLWDEDNDDDGELYCAKVEAFLPGFIEGIGQADAKVLYGQVFGVRYLAERFIEVLGDWDRRLEWVRLRQMFEGSTGIDLSLGYEGRKLHPLKIAAILEDFLASPEAARYEHGARYFWGHRIPD